MREQQKMVSVIIPVCNNGDYLQETLQSLERQSYPDFEVIVVNDGSTDGSEAIIDLFTQKDQRFHKINQKNSGVSAARNAALDKAKGRYVTFADGDDTLPKDALKKMAETALKTEADLIIGGIKRIDGFSEKINQRTEKLKYKTEIKKDDLDLVHGLSLCNKWFLKEIIEKNHLRLEKFRHLEDAVFLYHFLQYGEKIRYCDAIVYEYWKRIPTNGGSVTQRVEKGLLESAIGAYERLKQLTAGYSDTFQQELAYRINSTTFIGDYYKKLWSLDEETETLLLEVTDRIWKMQSEDHRTRTIASHPGLELERGLRRKEELLKEPLFAVLLSPNLSENEVNRILRSVYGQAVPSFCVFLDERYRTAAEEVFSKRENLFWIPMGDNPKAWMEAVRDRNAAYVLLIDEDAVLDYDTLAKAYQTLQKRACKMLKIRVVSSEKNLGLTGLLIKKDAVFSEEIQWNEDGTFSIRKQTDVVMQKEAPLIRIRDLERAAELTKPALWEKWKTKWKRSLIGLKHRLRKGLKR